MCPSLQELTLASGDDYEQLWLDLQRLSQLTGLTSLDLSDEEFGILCSRKHCDQLALLTHLKHLHVKGFDGASFLSQMTELSHLQYTFIASGWGRLAGTG